MPSDRRHSPTVRSRQELARMGQEAQSFFPVSFQLAIRRWHQGATPSGSTKVSWRWCGRQLSECRRRRPRGTGGAGATRVAASLSATRKRRPSTKRSSANRRAHVTERRRKYRPHSTELRRALARWPRLVLSPRRRRACCTARHSPSAYWAPSTPTPRRSATWAKVGEGHPVTGSGTGIVARKAGDIEDTLEPAGVRIDDRLAVAAQAAQLPDEMLVAVDSHRPTQLVAGGDRVGAGGLFAKERAVQRLPY